MHFGTEAEETEISMADKDVFSLKNAVAVVTGGAGNLGPHFGEALARAGASVVLADILAAKARGEKEADAIAARTGAKVRFHAMDVRDEKSVQNLMQWTAEEFGGLDVLVNGAIGTGKNHFAPMEEYDAEDFDKVLSITVTGTFLCCRAAAEIMKKNKGGSIINIASIYGVVGADQRIYGDSGINSPASYAASKGALVNMTRYMSVYWAKDNIRVNAISPGGVYNGQAEEFVEKYSHRTPLGRMAKKEDLQGAIVYLASPASSYVTGHNLMVDGGWTAW